MKDGVFCKGIKAEANSSKQEPVNEIEDKFNNETGDKEMPIHTYLCDP